MRFLAANNSNLTIYAELACGSPFNWPILSLSSMPSTELPEFSRSPPTSPPLPTKKRKAAITNTVATTETLISHHDGTSTSTALSITTAPILLNN
uniref:C2 and GRAM domain-containing protein At1g03370 isoform X2 n=1 Tax=Rhizophora mucronata TaxID=61149 RepID=A0A2P2PW01_RHIMU